MISCLRGGPHVSVTELGLDEHGEGGPDFYMAVTKRPGAALEKSRGDGGLPAGQPQRGRGQGHVAGVVDEYE